MKKNSSSGIIIGALVVVIVIVGIIRLGSTNTSAHSGDLYVGVKDASADIQNVNNVDMSVKKVEVHSAAHGWMTVASDAKTYSLLTLKSTGNTELYAKHNVPSGSYDRVRVTLGDTIVHTKSKGDVKAVMPTSQIVMNTTLNINDNKNSDIKLDFLADKSLHSTTDGQYVFAPVVNSESRSNADVSVSSDNMETVSGGTVDSNASVGVDLDGSSKTNFVLSTDQSLKVNTSLGSNLSFMLGGKNYTSDSAKMQESVSGESSTGTNAAGSSTTNASGSTSTSTSGSSASGASSTSGSANSGLDGAVNLTH